ncbi:thiolase family protein [Alcaligenes sp. SDU_A2]|uniref:thiolase family protein n=1 Tax=Alcaligenes sp. SDU_A2 TaxID=3136634 RepID=UPI00311D6377
MSPDFTWSTVRLLGATEVTYTRRGQRSTSELLALAFRQAVDQAGLHAKDIDGLGVASFTHTPDRAIDLAWKLGLQPRWIMDDSNGGASGLNILQHAIRAVQAGDAHAIAIVAGDHFEAEDFRRLVENYNQTTRDHLRPLGAGSPNQVFAMLTAAQTRTLGLERADYGALVMRQRQWAALNPQAVYRAPMSLDDYLNAPDVAWPLGRLDCVPVVDGANAIIVTRQDHAAAQGKPGITVRALRSLHNIDDQQGDGLSTGLARLGPQLWPESGLSPADMDVVSIYDDYPVMVLAQLQDLGFFQPQDAKRFIHDQIATGRLALNTSGGQLSAGQAGAACSLHGLVEVVRQLSGQAGERQVAQARYGLVTGYGMVEYRYGMCSTALILEALS